MALFDDTTRDLLRQINADAVASDDAFALSIALRRGDTILPGQQVRLAVHQAQERTTRTVGGKAVSVDGQLRGLPELDIALGDRFNSAGALLQVIFIRADRSIATIADVSIVL